MLFPQRGGYRLRKALESMLCVHPPFGSPEFSEASAVRNDPYYIDQLEAAIAPVNHRNSTFNFAVVDVGNSGSGTAKMDDLLRTIHAKQYRTQFWSVVFHVFHPKPDARPFTARVKCKDNVSVSVYTYHTDDRLLDDWIPGTGAAKTYRYIPNPSVGNALIRVPVMEVQILPAAVIVETSEGAHVLASLAGPSVGNRIISDSSTSALANSPLYRRESKFDLWQGPS